MATQVFYWDTYRQTCSEQNASLGKCLSVEVGEYLTGAAPLISELIASHVLSGLPRGWTSPHPGSVDVANFAHLFPQFQQALPATLSQHFVCSFKLEGLGHVARSELVHWRARPRAGLDGAETLTPFPCKRRQSI